MLNITMMMVRRTYLKYKYTQTDKNRITGEGSETAFQGTSTSTTFEEDRNYLIIPREYNINS